MQGQLSQRENWGLKSQGRAESRELARVDVPKEAFAVDVSFLKYRKLTSFAWMDMDARWPGFLGCLSLLPSAQQTQN